MLGVQGRYGEADMDIGSRIREHRAAAGMKQDELAQACFVSRQTISNWERNRTLPDIESLKAIAGIFGTTVDALIGDDAPAIVEQADEEARRLVSLWAASFVSQIAVFLLALMAYNQNAAMSDLLAILRAFFLGVYFATAIPFYRLERKKGIRTTNDLCCYVTDHMKETESLAIRAARSYFRHYRFWTNLMLGLLILVFLLVMGPNLTPDIIILAALLVVSILGFAHIVERSEKAKNADDSEAR